MFSVTRSGFLTQGLAVVLSPRLALDETEGDLALVRLVVAGELLAITFYERLLRGRALRESDRRPVLKALTQERDHYNALWPVVGPTVAQQDDFTYTFPGGTFTSRARAISFGALLETALLGTCLGAVPNVQSSELRLLLARIAASEAQHLSLFSSLHGGFPLGISFPNQLDEEQASDFQDRYLG
jgi:Ferritin-like domain